MNESVDNNRQSRKRRLSKTHTHTGQRHLNRFENISSNNCSSAFDDKKQKAMGQASTVENNFFLRINDLTKT